MEPVQNYYEENQLTQIINFDQLATFLQDTHGKSDIYNTALKFTDKIPDLVDLLKNTHKNVQLKSLKIRITKIMKKLNDSKYDSATDQCSSTEELT